MSNRLDLISLFFDRYSFLSAHTKQRWHYGWWHYPELPLNVSESNLHRSFVLLFFLDFDHQTWLPFSSVESFWLFPLMEAASSTIMLSRMNGLPEEFRFPFSVWCVMIVMMQSDRTRTCLQPFPLLLLHYCVLVACHGLNLTDNRTNNTNETERRKVQFPASHRRRRCPLLSALKARPLPIRRKMTLLVQKKNFVLQLELDEGTPETRSKARRSFADEKRENRTGKVSIERNYVTHCVGWRRHGALVTATFLWFSFRIETERKWKKKKKKTDEVNGCGFERIANDEPVDRGTQYKEDGQISKGTQNSVWITRNWIILNRYEDTNTQETQGCFQGLQWELEWVISDNAITRPLYHVGMVEASSS